MREMCLLACPTHRFAYTVWVHTGIQVSAVPYLQLRCLGMVADRCSGAWGWWPTETPFSFSLLYPYFPLLVLTLSLSPPPSPCSILVPPPPFLYSIIIPLPFPYSILIPAPFVHLSLFQPCPSTGSKPFWLIGSSRGARWLPSSTQQQLLPAVLLQRRRCQNLPLLPGLLRLLRWQQ